MVKFVARRGFLHASLLAGIAGVTGLEAAPAVSPPLAAWALRWGVRLRGTEGGYAGRLAGGRDEILRSAAELAELSRSRVRGSGSELSCAVDQQELRLDLAVV